MIVTMPTQTKKGRKCTRDLTYASLNEGVTFRVGELWATRSYGKHLPTVLLILLPGRVTEFSVFSARQPGIQPVYSFSFTLSPLL